MKRINREMTLKMLYGLGVAAILAGGGFWLWNPEPSAEYHDSAIRAADGAPPSMASAVDLTSVTGANIFSSTRTSPARRYNPADYESVDGSAPASMETTIQTEPALDLPQVFGTVLGPGGSMALMQGDSADGPGRLFREGDRVGRFRVIKVKANSVIVSGPTGRVEIKVERNHTGAQ